VEKKKVGQLVLVVVVRNPKHLIMYPQKLNQFSQDLKKSKMRMKLITVLKANTLIISMAPLKIN
jgi:hypothetical protein